MSNSRPPSQPPAPPAPWSGSGEEGMISLASLFAVLGLLLLIALMTNVARATTRKLEMQNSADAVAHAASVEMARGLNSVTTVNHLIGELTALNILHHGFGGDEADGMGEVEPTPTDVRIALEVTYNIAKLAASLGSVLKPLDKAYDEVREEPEVGGAIYDARIRLKQVLTWAYTAHAVGAFLAAICEKIPVIGAILSAIIHVAIILPAYAFEIKVLQEWYTLDGLEMMAGWVGYIKKLNQNAIIPGLHGYNIALSVQAPFQMEKAAKQVGEANQTTGLLYPGLKNFSLPFLQLPISREPEDPKAWQRSQLVRAATPWVQRWRVPVLQFGEDALLLSRFKCAYWDRTDEYTKLLTERLRKDKGVRLFTLDGWDPDGTPKGQEKWTKAAGSREADRMFGILGLAHRERVQIASFGVFRQPSPNGTVAYAQGMAYNANPQARQAGGADFQPAVGWDTLNWNSPVREFPGERPRDDTYPVPRVDEPTIRINWQAKLVPTTRLVEAILWQGGDVGQVLRSTPWRHLNLTGTH